VPEPSATSLTFKSFGVMLTLEFDDRALAGAARAALPVGARVVAAEMGQSRLRVDRFGRLAPDDPSAPPGPDGRPDAITRLATELRHHLALHSPDLFIHAGAVAIDGEALLLPGRSFAGKTTLVAALLELGADYISEEYAVVDVAGRVLPFAKDLAIRVNGQRVAQEIAPQAAGARHVVEEPVPARMVVVTRYLPDAQWAPYPISPSAAMLALLRHTATARSDSARALERTRRLCQGVRAFASLRGEAGPVAADLVARMREAARR
jgi:hypothetical protein